jgi:hypothetical protein
VAETRLIVNAPAVISEVIDGEAVIMNLASGHYFSCQGVAGDIWSLIEAGTTETRIFQHLLSRYSVDPGILSPAIDEFLSRLEEHELTRKESVSADGGNAEEPIPLPQEKADFSDPILNTYTDMEDLLLLDPIHDVDETGWPMPKPEVEVRD